MAWFFVEQANSGGSDEKGFINIRRPFKLWTDSNELYPPDVWGLIPILRWSSHPAAPEAIAIDVKVDPVDEGATLWWKVVYQYSSKSTEQQTGNSEQDAPANDKSVDPDSRPPIITYGPEKGERILAEDLDGVPVLNANNEPYDPPISLPCSHLQINIEAYKPMSFEPVSKFLQYQDSINSLPFLLTVTPTTTQTFPARTVNCTNYAPTPVQEKGEFWWKINITLIYRPVPWNPIKVLNASKMRAVGAGKPLVNILDQHGHPVQSAVPITNNVLGLTGPLNIDDTPIYNSYKGYNEANFANLLT